MGIAGAAIATVAGQIVAALVVMKRGYRKSPAANLYRKRIPEIFRLMNYHRVYGLTDFARASYARIAGEGGKDASACVSCGACEKKCPQHLKIREQLRATHAALSE